MSLTLSRNNVRALYAYAVSRDDGAVLGYIRQGRRGGSVRYLWSADNAPSTDRKGWHDLGPVTHFPSIRAAAESYLRPLDLEPAAPVEPAPDAFFRHRGWNGHAWAGPGQGKLFIVTGRGERDGRATVNGEAMDGSTASNAFVEVVEFCDREGRPLPDASAEITRVAFRVFPEGDVIALFPDHVEGRGTISSFQHVGQHGGASVDLVEELRPATVEESADLRRELERAPYHYRFADYDPPAPAGAPADVEASPFTGLAPGEAAGWLKTEPRTPVAILEERGEGWPAYRVRFLAPGHGHDTGETAWYGKGSSVIQAEMVPQPVQQQQARAGRPLRACPVYHPLTVDALRLYQSCAKNNLRRSPDADADREFAGAADFAASEGSAVDPVTMVRNYTRELCAEQLAKARKIRAGMRAAGQWQGENAPMDLARVQERIWLYREDRRSFLAAAARAAASAPSEAAGEASDAGQVAETVTMPTAWASYLVNGDASGLDDGEAERIAAHLKATLPDDATVVDRVEGSERFTWSFDLHGGDAKGGDVSDYTVLRPGARAAVQRAAMVEQPAQLQQARAAGPVRDQFGDSYPDHKAWLAEQFEFERCAECGGDAPHHTAVPLMGNWFARCDHAPGPDGAPHPTIRAFLAAACHGPGA